MKNAFSIFMVFALAGCASRSSQYERPGQNYPNFILSLYDDPKTPPRPAAPVAPMRIAVAQVGDLVPPQAMLDHLRQNKAMFTRVEGIPATFDDYGTQGGVNPNRQITRERVARLQRMAQDLGLDY